MAEIFCKMSADTMYSLSSHCNVSNEIPLPDCMYKMGSYHTKEMKEGASAGAWNDLQQRQEKIICDIDELKNELDQMEKLLADNKSSTWRKSYSGKGSETKESGERQKTKITNTPRHIKDNEVFDVVISTSIDSLPICTFILSHALREKGYSVGTPCYCHSSLQMPLPAELSTCLDKHYPSSITRKGLLLTFIFKKDVFVPSFIISPLQQSRVCGDANIAKYLCAEFIPEIYDYQNVEQSTVNNYWIDLCIKQLLNGSSKEKAAMLRTCNAGLGKHQWLTGDSIGLADVLLWSSMVANNVKPDKNSNVVRWFKQCCQHPWFTNVANSFEMSTLKE